MQARGHYQAATHITKKLSLETIARWRKLYLHRGYMKEYFSDSHEVEYIPQQICLSSCGIMASREAGKDSLSEPPAAGMAPIQINIEQNLEGTSNYCPTRAATCHLHNRIFILDATALWQQIRGEILKVTERHQQTIVINLGKKYLAPNSISDGENRKEVAEFMHDFECGHTGNKQIRRAEIVLNETFSVELRARKPNNTGGFRRKWEKMKKRSM